VSGPFYRLGGMIGDSAHKFRMIEPQTGLHHVFEKQLGRILDILLALQKIIWGSQASITDASVAAGNRHFFQDENLTTRQPGFNSGSKTGKSTSNDNNLGRFIPMIHVHLPRSGFISKELMLSRNTQKKPMVSNC
jgi:hypothetical protein